MGSSILAAFANETLATATHSFEDGTPYAKAMDKLCACEKALFAYLDEDGKKVYDACYDAQMELAALTLEDRFIYGYRLGVLMMEEVFSSKGELLKNPRG